MPKLDQPQPLAPDPKKELPLEPALEQVLQAIAALSEALAQESVPFDLIVQTMKLDSGSVSGALLQLELLGRVAQLPGMRYRQCDSFS